MDKITFSRILFVVCAVVSLVFLGALKLFPEFAHIFLIIAALCYAGTGIYAVIYFRCWKCGESLWRNNSDVFSANFCTTCGADIFNYEDKDPDNL